MKPTLVELSFPNLPDLISFKKLVRAAASAATGVISTRSPSMVAVQFRSRASSDRLRSVSLSASTQIKTPLPLAAASAICSVDGAGAEHADAVIAIGTAAASKNVGEVTDPP